MLLGLAATLTALATWPLSVWGGVTLGWGVYEVEVEHGMVFVGTDHLGPHDRRWRFEWHRMEGMNWALRPVRIGEGYWNGIRTPLWIVAAGTSMLTAFLATLSWRCRRRRYPRGLCSTCGYDLTGNVSGICSECGRPRAAGFSADRSK